MPAVNVVLQPGTELASYRIESIIGRGGMGIVYLAIQPRLGRRVALKVLAPELAEDDEFRERFMRESEVAASLEHPNVLPVYDAGEASGVLYLAMRYVDGQDLHAFLLQEVTLSPQRTVEVMSQVAGALDAAHRAGLVHRDVKPANILLAGDGHVYLSDFGIAKRIATTGLTRTGSFLGSVDYCAPEQIEDRPVDGKADVYALGCVAFHCLAGRPPFDKGTDVAVVKAHLLDPPPALSTVRPDLPRALDGVIVIAMAKHPEVRYGTAKELADALAQAVAEPTKAAPAPSPETLPKPAFGPTVVEERVVTTPVADDRRARRRRWPLVAGVLLVLAAASGGIAAFVLTRGSDEKVAATTTASTVPAAPPPFSLSVSSYLSRVGSKQRVVTARVRTVQTGLRSFAALRAASDDLATSISRTQGSLETLTPRTTEDRGLLGGVRSALAAHLAYANLLRNLPELPRLLTKAQARKIVAAAADAEVAYNRLDDSVPAVEMSVDVHQRLVTIVQTPPAATFFASIDRLQHCYVTAKLARCGSGPSGKVVQVRAGGPAVYLGRLGSQDRGGRALRFGESVTSPGGAIRCESSYRGITCTDRSSGAGFTIGDRRHFLTSGSSATPSPLPAPTAPSANVGVPGTYTGNFTSVDRLQHCYATSDYVRCGSGPSGQVVELRAGGKARYLGVLGSTDNGGPSMPMGTAFRTPTGAISCGSSSRGITCTDTASGQTFTIGDHYMRVNGVRIGA